MSVAVADHSAELRQMREKDSEFEELFSNVQNIVSRLSQSEESAADIPKDTIYTATRDRLISRLSQPDVIAALKTLFDAPSRQNSESVGAHIWDSIMKQHPRLFVSAEEGKSVLMKMSKEVHASPLECAEAIKRIAEKRTGNSLDEIVRLVRFDLLGKWLPKINLIRSLFLFGEHGDAAMERFLAQHLLKVEGADSSVPLVTNTVKFLTSLYDAESDAHFVMSHRARLALWHVLCLCTERRPPCLRPQGATIIKLAESACFTHRILENYDVVGDAWNWSPITEQVVAYLAYTAIILSSDIEINESSQLIAQPMFSVYLLSRGLLGKSPDKIVSAAERGCFDSAIKVLSRESVSSSIILAPILHRILRRFLVEIMCFHLDVLRILFVKVESFVRTVSEGGSQFGYMYAAESESKPTFAAVDFVRLLSLIKPTILPSETDQIEYFLSKRLPSVVDDLEYTPLGAAFYRYLLASSQETAVDTEMLYNAVTGYRRALEDGKISTDDEDLLISVIDLLWIHCKKDPHNTLDACIVQLRGYLSCRNVPCSVMGAVLAFLSNAFELLEESSGNADLTDASIIPYPVVSFDIPGFKQMLATSMQVRSLCHQFLEVEGLVGKYPEAIGFFRLMKWLPLSDDHIDYIASVVLPSLSRRFVQVESDRNQMYLSCFEILHRYLDPVVFQRYLCFAAPSPLFLCILSFISVSGAERLAQPSASVVFTDVHIQALSMAFRILVDAVNIELSMNTGSKTASSICEKCVLNDGFVESTSVLLDVPSAGELLYLLSCSTDSGRRISSVIKYSGAENAFSFIVRIILRSFDFSLPDGGSQTSCFWEVVRLLRTCLFEHVSLFVHDLIPLCSAVPITLSILHDFVFDSKQKHAHLDEIVGSVAVAHAHIITDTDMNNLTPESIRQIGLLCSMCSAHSLDGDLGPGVFIVLDAALKIPFLERMFSILNSWKMAASAFDAFQLDDVFVSALQLCFRINTEGIEEISIPQLRRLCRSRGTSDNIVNALCESAVRLNQSKVAEHADFAFSRGISKLCVAACKSTVSGLPKTLARSSHDHFLASSQPNFSVSWNECVSLFLNVVAMRSAESQKFISSMSSFVMLSNPEVNQETMLPSLMSVLFSKNLHPLSIECRVSFISLVVRILSPTTNVSMESSQKERFRQILSSMSRVVIKGILEDILIGNSSLSSVALGGLTLLLPLTDFPVGDALNALLPFVVSISSDGRDVGKSALRFLLGVASHLQPTHVDALVSCPLVGLFFDRILQIVFLNNTSAVSRLFVSRFEASLLRMLDTELWKVSDFKVRSTVVQTLSVLIRGSDPKTIEGSVKNILFRFTSEIQVSDPSYSEFYIDVIMNCLLFLCGTVGDSRLSFLDFQQLCGLFVLFRWLSLFAVELSSVLRSLSSADNQWDLIRKASSFLREGDYVSDSSFLVSPDLVNAILLPRLNKLSIAVLFASDCSMILFIQHFRAFRASNGRDGGHVFLGYDPVSLASLIDGFVSSFSALDSRFPDFVRQGLIAELRSSS
eukprot:ANDGO_05108.mRNA.1 hypothetical protein